MKEDRDYLPTDQGNVPEREGRNKPLSEEERKDYYEKLDEIALDDEIPF